jgi:hypothetical protein
VTDRVMLVGFGPSVKAGVDLNGTGTLAENDEMKAGLATVGADYVAIAVTRTRAQLEVVARQLSSVSSANLDATQIDETILGMVPAWSAVTVRIENDALVARTAGPSWTIGVDATNRKSDVLGHVPARTIFYLDAHDLGPTAKAIVDRFRALPETKPVFDQVDQALSLLGGFDAVVSWWGDSALVLSPLADGTMGGGLVIKPRDAAAAQRLLTTIDGFLAFGGASAGVTTRSEDHNGTKVTILDLSAVPGMDASSLPPGYKPELAWATNDQITVLGYGAAFVKEVLDAGPGSSLADDPRFAALLGRVGGADNIGVGFVDVAGIRALVEPIIQSAAPEKWTEYTTEIRPYLEHLDAVIQTIRKDQGLDVGTGHLTVR